MATPVQFYIYLNDTFCSFEKITSQYYTRHANLIKTHDKCQRSSENNKHFGTRVFTNHLKPIIKEMSNSIVGKPEAEDTP